MILALDRMFHLVIAIAKVKFHPPPPRKAWYFTDFTFRSISTVECDH